MTANDADVTTCRMMSFMPRRLRATLRRLICYTLRHVTYAIGDHANMHVCLLLRATTYVAAALSLRHAHETLSPRHDVCSRRINTRSAHFTDVIVAHAAITWFRPRDINVGVICAIYATRAIADAHDATNITTLNVFTSYAPATRSTSLSFNYHFIINTTHINMRTSAKTSAILFPLSFITPRRQQHVTLMPRHHAHAHAYKKRKKERKKEEKKVIKKEKKENIEIWSVKRIKSMKEKV